MLFRIRFKGMVPSGKEDSGQPVSSAVTTCHSPTVPDHLLETKEYQNCHYLIFQQGRALRFF